MSDLRSMHAVPRPLHDEPVFETVSPGRFRATPLGTGPWDPGALHGGAPCGLVAGLLGAAVDEHADAVGVRLAPTRFAAELLRPVPLGELDVRVDLRRRGRKVAVADAFVTTSDGTEVLRATLGAIRAAAFDHGHPDTTPVPAPPEGGVPLDADTWPGERTFHHDAVEHRSVVGRFSEPGPATHWIRLRRPLLDEEVPSPLQRVVAAADFGNGVSRLFDKGEAVFVNPDLTVFLQRLPIGEWICLDAVTHLGPEGVGLAESRLFDLDGPVGRSAQMLLVEPR